ncbi:MAG TPA: 1-acyl-sn-glycerol-3-phosphate acyltransferase [Terriglobia bacterium]|nr:1-acyl-sn-glycerol-3-phosphate acyltransferase [Terriglobia bacterium]
MSVGDPLPAQTPPPSLGYRIFRGLARAWISLFFRKVRIVNPGVLPDAGAALLLIGHPASFIDAVILVTAFEREVICLLDRRFLRGPLRAALARFLGMIPFQAEGEGFPQAMERTQAVLRSGQTLLVFASDQPTKPGDVAPSFSHPAAMAMQAESQSSGELWLEVFPVHLFLPVAQLYSCELLIYLDAPLIPREYLARGGNLTEQARALAAAAEESCCRNALRLQPEDIRFFLSDLEELLRADLEENWRTRPNWKQKVDGFTLSQFVGECVERLNCLHPGELVALRDLLATYREAQRQRSLAQLQLEQAGQWLQSPWRRALCWVGSVAAFPLAAYGLVNHLVPALIMYFTGLLENKETQNQSARWAVRGLILLGSYALQILVCANWLGRTVTGYYAPMLPVFGVLLLGYLWLVWYRTRFLLLDFRSARLSAKLAPMRRELIRELNAARDAYAETLGLAH